MNKGRHGWTQNKQRKDGGLPTDMIAQILSCSPINSLLRFRCVSKSFCFLIDSPHFINTHLNLSHKNNINLIILQKFDPRSLFSLDFDSLHTLVPFHNKFTSEYILGSCNGLVLLGSDGQLQLAFVNPSTREYRRIPDPPGRHVYGEIVKAQSCGLAYDSFNIDYKVIKVVMNELWVYSLKSNFWKLISGFPYYIPGWPWYYAWRADVSGILHMVVKKSSMDSTKLIVAVDVARECFYVVPEPHIMNKQEYEANVDVLGGRLSLVVLNRGYTDVWVMNVYGVKESWTKLFSLLPTTVYDFVFVGLLGYSKKQNEVLLNINICNLVWLNLETGEIKDVKVRGLPKKFSSRVYMSTLVPLNGYGEWCTETRT